MIWTDPTTGRRWDVHPLGRIGRIGRPIPSDPEDWRGDILREGAIVLVFETVDGPGESRVVSGAPENWAERPATIAELFAQAGRRRERRSD